MSIIYTEYGKEFKLHAPHVLRAIAYPNIYIMTPLGQHIAIQTALLSDMLKLPIESNKAVDVFRSIRTGGTGSFTNKINMAGFFNNDVDIDQLKENSHLIFNLALYLVNKVAHISPETNCGTLEKYVKIYRFVDTSNTLYNTIIQPIPCSCTWSHDIADGWRGTRTCCMYEIIIPQSSLFISSSCPFLSPYDENMYYEGNYYLLHNQDQMEVILPPCVLKKLSTRFEKGIVIITYLANIIPENDISYMIDIVHKYGTLYQISNDYLNYISSMII